MTAPILVSFSIALLATPLLRWLSHRHELLDVPNERSSHVRPTPRTGGVAIGAAIVCAFAAFGGLNDSRSGATLACGCAIALLGLIDDFRALPALPKLVVHIFAALAAAAFAGVTLDAVAVPLAGVIDLGLLAIPVTIVWIVGGTNAFNFMDGVNGIAATEAIVCGVAYSWLLGRQGDAPGALFALVIAAASAGFLAWNAGGSIFMGDVGSGMLGFLLACLTLRVSSSGIPFPAAMLPLFPFLFDTAVTLARRAGRRERLFSAHRSHFYQQLTDLGWSHLQVASLWGALAAGCSAATFAYGRMTEAGRVAALGIVMIVHVALASAIAAAKRKRASG